KHFKNCLGALDGTHIKLRVRTEDQTRYRDRKGDLSMNVLGVCNPNLEFIYCLAGWEGSAHDVRVVRDALSRPNGLKIPKGTYYLCDAGYTNCEGLLTPFRGQRYHLKEWGPNPPNTPEELFNNKHVKVRNVIEKAFGVLKMRWAILRDTSWFSPEVMMSIVNACILLHNFIKREQGADIFERMYGTNHVETEPSFPIDEVEDIISFIQPSPEWSQFRINKAQEMWANRFRR
ncbi:Protein ALP1-like, partial [Linum perenne]